MTALELCELADLSPDAHQAAQSGLPPRTFIEQLVRLGNVRGALSALAQMLPKAEAIAWGLASIRGVEAATKNRGFDETAGAIEAWLAEPNDERRRAARAMAEKSGTGTPAGCLGMAVFFSGGSMAPADSPVSPEPARNVSGKLIAGALALTVALDPLHAAERLRAFYDSGMRIANRDKIWEKEI